jgi:hypothetical protein
MDGIKAASRHARSILAEVARLRADDDAAEAAGRARIASERAAFYGARGRLPFGSGDDGDAECSGPDCEVCAEYASAGGDAGQATRAAGPGLSVRTVPDAIVSIR